MIKTARSACGVTNAYHAPGDLGADRWVAMIAAHHRVAGAVCVIDCGTAVTVDLVAASGEHRGGLILPGVRLLGQTLAVNTAGIHLQVDAAATGLLGRTTREGVIGGAQYLVAAAIDRIAADVIGHAGEPVTVIITGGDSLSRNRLAASLLDELLPALDTFESGGLGPFMDEWREHDVLAGQPIDLLLPDRTVSGRACGIDDGGALLMDTAAGRKRFAAGEASLRVVT